MGNRSLFPAGERSEPRSRTAPKGLPQTEARDAKRGGPPLESPCRQLSLVLSFASKESTAPLGAAAPTSAPESARHAPGRKLLPAELSCNASCRGLSARPLHPFGSSSENNAYGTASPTPAPESARQAPPKNIPAPECPHKKAEAAHSAPLPLSHLFQGIKLPAPVDLPGKPFRRFAGNKIRRAAHRLIFAKRVRHRINP